MISVDNLTVSFGSFTLLDSISFAANDNDRIGLVGKNGAGKSTILKIFAGLQQPASGSVSIPGDITVGYLPQQPTAAEGKTVREETATAFTALNELENETTELTKRLNAETDYESDDCMRLIEKLHEAELRYGILGGADKDGDVEQTLLGLGFKRSDFDRPTAEFGGGWRMRIELAKILLVKPRLLLLDEPTNHLDIESIQWVEDYLKNRNGALILISHDRAFLDAVCNRTIEIVLGKIHDYKVSYSQYTVLRRERREQQIAAYENQRKMIEKTEEFIERFRYKATKSNQVQSRIKQLEKLDIIEIDDEDAAKLNIKFPPAPRSGRVVFRAEGLTKRYGDHTVFSDANLIVEQGEKIAFVGRNGEGKSTMVKIIVDDLPYDEGEATPGYNVKIGYFAQNQDEIMTENDTVFETLDRVAVGDIRTRLRDILGAFLFKGEDVDKKVKVLSGGERSRLAMARLMLEPCNLLVLDEPTNHLDMRSKDILKNALRQFDGTLIIISHDREFLDGLVDKIYEFRDGRVKEYLGGIFDFLQRLKSEDPKNRERPTETANEKEANEIGKSSKTDYADKKNRDREIRKLENKIAQVENKIEELEIETVGMDSILATPEGEIPTDFYRRYEEVKNRLNSAMNEWENLNAELEEFRIRFVSRTQ